MFVDILMGKKPLEGKWDKIDSDKREISISQSPSIDFNAPKYKH